MKIKLIKNERILIEQIIGWQGFGSIKEILNEIQRKECEKLFDRFDNDENKNILDISNDELEIIILAISTTIEELGPEEFSTIIGGIHINEGKELLEKLKNLKREE